MTDIRCQMSAGAIFLLAAYLSLSLPVSAAGFDPEAYEAEICKQARIPSDWLACKTDKDCTIATVPCQTGIAVARKFKVNTESAICQAESCAQVCNTSLIEHSYAVCEDDACALHLGVRKVEKPDKKADKDKSDDSEAPW